MANVDYMEYCVPLSRSKLFQRMRSNSKLLTKPNLSNFDNNFASVDGSDILTGRPEQLGE
jgi:hypothetical protein